MAIWQLSQYGSVKGCRDALLKRLGDGEENIQLIVIVNSGKILVVRASCSLLTLN
ncbi:MAG: hypothetical protein RID09_21015 [Coleofasciculus sp. G1-WW12-02]|uniref:hypothetical protein n=1 Tax=Coleofasciculus sp. G1-WW12-02 TaxID=3068483 RepID=UPI0032F2D0B8